MKWFRVVELLHTREGIRDAYRTRILATSYGHAYAILARRYGTARQFSVASVPPMVDWKSFGVACNLRPRSFIVGL